jgi:hypothetical protein
MTRLGKMTRWLRQMREGLDVRPRCDQTGPGGSGDFAEAPIEAKQGFRRAEAAYGESGELAGKNIQGAGRRLTLTLALPMNMNLLTPTLSSTSVWRRGRWNGARGLWGTMREILRGILSTNMNRKWNLLTPTLSSTSVWRRGRWNGARGFWGSMGEILRRMLSPAEGTEQGGAGRIKPNQTCGRKQWTVASGQWPVTSNQTCEGGVGPVASGWWRAAGRPAGQTQSKPVKPVSVSQDSEQIKRGPPTPRLPPARYALWRTRRWTSPLCGLLAPPDSQTQSNSVKPARVRWGQWSVASGWWQTGSGIQPRQTQSNLRAKIVASGQWLLDSD